MNGTELRKPLLRLAVSLGVAALFWGLLRAGALPLVPDPAALRAVRWWTVAVYLGMWSVVHVLRAARWQLLLRPLCGVSLGRVLHAAFIGFLAVLALPLRTGEFVRPLLIRRKGELSAWSALGTIGAERIVDGWVLSVMLFLALELSPRLSPLPRRLGDLPISVSLIPTAAYTALGLFAMALVAMTVFHFWQKKAQRLLMLTVGCVSPAAAHWLGARVAKLSAGLGFLSRWRDAVPFVAFTVAYWALNAAATWLLAWGVGLPDFGYGAACVLTGVLALGILVPNAPGFFGTYQLSLYGALALFYPEEVVRGRGAALVFLLYLGQIGVTLAFALLAWLSSARFAESSGAGETVSHG